MNELNVVCTEGKLKLIFSEYKIEDGNAVIELSAEEVDELMQYIELSEDIDKGFL